MNFRYLPIYETEFTDYEEIGDTLKRLLKNAEYVVCKTENDDREDDIDENGFFGKCQLGFVLVDSDNEDLRQFKDVYFDYYPKFDIYVYQTIETRSFQPFYWFYILQKANILTIPQSISTKLANFCKCSKISRSECHKIIMKYIKDNCVNDRDIVILDDKLADLLNFKEFQENVKQGKFFRIDADWVLEMFKQWENGVKEITFTFVLHMLSFHFKNSSLQKLNDMCKFVGLPVFDVYPYPLQEEQVEILYKCLKIDKYQ